MMSSFSEFSVTQQCRESEELPVENIIVFLQQQLPKFLKNKSLDINQFSGGASNLTYRLSSGDNSLILRRPPMGTKAKSAHDMAREYHVLKTIGEFYSLSPKPILLCEDEQVLGDKFFVMEQIKGLGIDKNLPVEMTEHQQWKLCENYVDGLVLLHQIDISQPPLADLGKPEGYVKRQLDGWQKRYENAKTDDVSSSIEIYHWLQQHLDFDSGYQSLVHNDYKFDNFIVDPKSPQNIIGVLDWEMTTLGDPLLDLGCSLAYWVQADDPKTMQAIRMMPTQLSGMMTREQVFNRYCEKSGIINIELTPYYVFGLFRLAVIAQQIYYRFYHGQTSNQSFKDFGQLVNILLAHAKQQINL